MNNAVPHRLLLELLYQRAGRFFFHGITTKLKRSPRLHGSRKFWTIGELCSMNPLAHLHIFD